MTQKINKAGRHDTLYIMQEIQQILGKSDLLKKS